MAAASVSRRLGRNVAGNHGRFLAGRLAVAHIRSLLVAGLVVSALLPASLIASAPGLAQSGNAQIREIQRLLWALDYGADRLNGADSRAMRERAAKFLADRGKGRTSTDDELVAELRVAFQEKRAAALRPAPSPRFLDQRPLSDTYSDDVGMVVDSASDLVLAGNCDLINRYRLSSGTPLQEFRLACGRGGFVFSPALGTLTMAMAWDSDREGLMIADAATGLRMDFIDVPDSTFLSKLALHPNGREVVLLTTKNLWRVDLQRRSVVRLASLASGQNGVVTKRVTFSGDGRYVGAVWSRQVQRSKFVDQARVWDLATSRTVLERNASGLVLSADGRYIATRADDSTIEIREAVGGRVVAKRKFSNDDPRLSNERTPAVFDRSGTSLLYIPPYESVGRLLAWNWSTGEIKQLLALGEVPDRAIIDLAADRLYAISGVDVLTYDLKTAMAATRPGRKTTAIAPTAAVLSPDAKTVAFLRPSSITLVSAETGAVRDVAVAGDRRLSSLAFRPDSEGLLIGDEKGALAVMDTRTGALRELASLDGGEIKGVVVAATRPLAAVIQYKHIVVVDIADGRVVRRLPLKSSHNTTSRGVAFVDNEQRLFYGDEYRAIAVDLTSGRRVLDHELRSNVKTEGRRRTWMWAWVGYVLPTTPGSNRFWVGASSHGSNILYEYSDGRLSRQQGGPVSGSAFTNFLPAGAAAAATDADGLMLTVQFRTPRTLRANEDQFRSRHADLRENPLLIGALGNGRFVTADQSGEVRIYGISESEPLVRVLLYGDGHWLSRTDHGFFAGTREAAENLFIALGPDDAARLDGFFDALYRPDLVREVIAGDPKGLAREAAEKLDLAKAVASGAAPLVAIRSPAAGTRVDADRVTVEAEIVPQAGGIGRVEWRVNGVTLGVSTRGLGRVDAPAAGMQKISQVLDLEAGDNVIELVAYNAANLIASPPARLTVAWDGTTGSTPPRLHVLAVGVNDYWDGRLRLNHAVADAQALGAALQKSGSDLYERVVVTTLTDGDVNVAKLDATFAAFAGSVRARDVFVFFLAGHGKTVDGRYFFLPQDFRYRGEESILSDGIGQERWQAWFAKIPARKSVLIYDTCESGTLTGDQVAMRGLERSAALDRLTRATGRTTLTAATDVAPALEGYRGHGVFTYALLDGIGAADGNKNGLIEVTELAAHVDGLVPEVSYKAFKLRQVPQMRVQGSNFPLARAMQVLAAAPPAEAAVPAAPTKPTHVVVQAVEVFAEPGGRGASVQRLAPGTLVVLVRGAEGWVLVAREGRVLGYVPTTSVAAMQ